MKNNASLISYYEKIVANPPSREEYALPETPLADLLAQIAEVEQSQTRRGNGFLALVYLLGAAALACSPAKDKLGLFALLGFVCFPFVKWISMHAGKWSQPMAAFLKRARHYAAACASYESAKGELDQLKTESHWRGLSPARFEASVAEFFRHAKGYRARVVGRANDGGVDIELFNEADQLVAIAQCKAYTRKKLSPGTIRDLIGTMHIRRTRVAYIVTLSGLSQSSQKLCDEHGIEHIGLQSLMQMSRRDLHLNQVI